jgi:GNAT superfamily N-acetyltransferase
MRYAQYDAGEQKPRHQILLHHDGDQVGDMEWYGKTGIIHHVNVDEEHSRKGLATAMWNWGQEMKRPPKHSADRTDNGDAWAKAVGGPRPRKAKYSAMDEIQALAEKAPGWEHEHEWLPHERIFSAGKGGLDPRLFNPKTRIMLPGPEHATLGDLDDYWRPLYGPGWRNWARVYLAGSQASEWWGNNDFDTLIGIDHNKLRETLPEFQGITDVMIDAKLTAGLRDHLNSEEYLAPWDGQIWHRTFFVNPNSWDIRKIKPYAAYDITNRRWAVEPVKAGLDWGPLKLPEALFSEGEALVQQVNAIEKLPEPQRSGRGAALWDYLHNDRRRAFSDEGEGVFDTGNAVWKYLDMHPSAPLTRLLDMKRHVLQQEHAA